MPNKNRSQDTKPSAEKNTLNPPPGGTPVPDPSDPASAPNNPAPDQKIGQFTGAGAPGIQKK